MEKSVLVAVLGAVSCGGEEPAATPAPTPTTAAPPPVEPAPCVAPDRLVGSSCLRPGQQDDGCEAGTLGLEDGSCVAAGVRPEMCPDNWEHDGDAACEPILPSADCPEGMLALPGETSCHPVADCGTGPWGDIPVEAGKTRYVDQSYLEADADGTEAHPFPTIGDAVGAAADGDIVAIAAGSYAEEVLVQGKSLRLWGACPGAVEVSGTSMPSQGFGTIEVVGDGASGSELHGLAISTSADSRRGLQVRDADDVTLSHLWVHDCAERGIVLTEAAGATLRASLLENNRDAGVMLFGTTATIEALVVRDTQPRASDQRFGDGLLVQPDAPTNTPSAIVLRQAIFERNHRAGVALFGSKGTLEGIVVRGTRPEEASQSLGSGVLLLPSTSTGLTSTLELRGGLLERNHHYGIFVGAAEAEIEGVVVRDTAPRPSDQGFGRGIAIQPTSTTFTSASANIRGVLVEGNRNAGIYFGGVTGTVEGALIRDTTAPGAIGLGLGVARSSINGAPSSVQVRGSVMAGNLGMGVYVVGSEASLDGIVVRDTLVDTRLTGGLFVQSGSEGRASVQVRGSRFERNPFVGIGVDDADVLLDGVLVDETLPDDAGGVFGDGVSGLRGASITLQSSQVGNSARAGLSLFGASATLTDAVLGCADVATVSIQPLESRVSTAEGLEEAICACPVEAEAARGTCEAVDAALEPIPSTSL